MSGKSGGVLISAELARIAALFEQQNRLFEQYEPSVQTAQEIKNNSPRRLNIPVRDSFVLKSSNNQNLPPLTRIVSRGGRGGAVALKLYLALLWKCAAWPYEATIPGRKWAELLALDDPKAKGSRRIAKALDLLEELQLVSIVRRPGDVSTVTLLDESGDGSMYRPAPDANVKTQEDRDRYFKVSTALWTSKSAYMQRMSSAALAMLLLLLQFGAGRKDDEESLYGKEVWWSVQLYKKLYAISPAMRSRGTKDLFHLDLLDVRKQSVTATGRKESFTPERVRSIYRLHGAALEIPHENS